MRGKWLWIPVLMALLPFGMVAMVGTQAGATAPAASAKKKRKCGKKKPKKAEASKKKKKKKCGKPTGGGGDTPASPVVRATLTWTGGGSSSADLDLFVFDSAGLKAGNGVDTIPQSTLSPDISGTSGTETFTDLNPQPLRAFSFAVCYIVGGSVHTPFKITYLTADGVTHTDSQDPGNTFHYEYPAGPVIPHYCSNF